MTPLVGTVTYIMGVGTLAISLALLVFIVVTIFSAQWREWLHEHIGTHGTTVALGIVAASIVGSLFYSQVAGFEACYLCWLVRFAVYPQILLLGIYLYKPHHWLLTVSFVMSIAAAVISAYQVWLQLGGTAIINCSLIPSLGDCETKYFQIFGYITLASMSLLSTVTLAVCEGVTLHRKHWIKR